MALEKGTESKLKRKEIKWMGENTSRNTGGTRNDGRNKEEKIT